LGKKKDCALKPSTQKNFFGNRKNAGAQGEREAKLRPKFGGAGGEGKPADMFDCVHLSKLTRG